MALPHLRNSQAGVNKYDPVFKACFEVTFDLPEAIRAQFNGDRTLLTEHVLTVTGMDALEKSPDIGSQKFMSTTRSFINPTIDNTSADDIGVTFSLNLRDGTDNYIYKIFRAWARLGYDISTGERHLKKDYCSDWMKIRIANQAGDVYREVVFKDVMLKSVKMDDGLDYASNDAVGLEVHFTSDWWDDIVA